MSIEALREWARVAGGEVENINQNLNGVEQLISTTNADMKRLRIVLSAAEKKQAEMIQTQHACMAKVSGSCLRVHVQYSTVDAKGKFRMCREFRGVFAYLAGRIISDG